MRLPDFICRQENESWHEYLYFIGMIIISLMLPFSRLLLSSIQILLVVNWLIEGRFAVKKERFFANSHAMYLMLVFVLFAVAMAWTYQPLDRIYVSLKDKAPFLTLPLLAVTGRPLDWQRVQAILIAFIFSVFAVSLAGFLMFVADPEAGRTTFSPFMHHLRFGIMVVMVIFLSIWLAHKANAPIKIKVVAWSISIFLSGIMFLAGWITALVAFGATIGFLLLKNIFSVKKSPINRAFAALALLLSVAVTSAVLYFVAEPVFRQIPKPQITGLERTRYGNPYYHDFENLRLENGHLVYWFIAEDELRKAWNNRSRLDFDGYDYQGSPYFKGTIFRYLASKGLRKDSESLNSLKDYEIRAIENGVPNYLHTRWPGVLIRLHQTFWEIQEYRRTGNPEGFSLAQRIELWRAAWNAFLERPIVGWGKGGVHHAMNFGLDQIQSQWEMRNLKPHSQYLLYLITLGIVGAIAVFVLMYLFVQKSGAWRFLPFQIMMVIVFSSMMGEDLLDFQEPISFFMLFMVVFGILLHKSNTSNFETSQ